MAAENSSSDFTAQMQTKARGSVNAARRRLVVQFQCPGPHLALSRPSSPRERSRVRAHVEFAESAKVYHHPAATISEALPPEPAWHEKPIARRRSFGDLCSPSGAMDCGLTNPARAGMQQR